MDLTTDAPKGYGEGQGSIKLQDEGFVKQLTAIFCDGLFSYADEEMATSIIERSLKLCDGSRDTLSDVVQTRFFAKQSPFHLAIANRRVDGGLSPFVSRKLVPPLLSKLFEICGDLKKNTQEEIMQALYIESNNDLFEAISGKLPIFYRPPSQSFLDDPEQKPKFTVFYHGPDKFTINFKIPRFYNRMLIDKDVSYQFLASGSLWQLRALPVEEQGSHGETLAWKLELEETHSKHTYPTSASAGFYIQRTTTVSVKPAVGRTHSEAFTTKCTQLPSTATVRLSGTMSQFHSNPLIAGANRELSGSIIVEDSRHEVATQITSSFATFFAASRR